MTGRKPKIALCISGEPRCEFDTFAYIYNAFLTHSKYDTDVYIHSLKPILSLNLYQPKTYLIEPNIENLILKKTLSKLKNYPNINFVGNCNNTILMYYSMHKCFSLIEDRYDVYVRLRFDSLFNPKNDFSPLIDSVLNGKHEIHIPKTHEEHSHWKNLNLPGGYNDRFAIGNFNSMNVYFNTYLSMNDISLKTKTFNTHSLLFNQLNFNNIKVNNLIMNDFLLRSSKKIISTPLNNK